MATKKPKREYVEPPKDAIGRTWPTAVIGLGFHAFPSLQKILREGDELVIVREPNNEHDANAIAVYRETGWLIKNRQKIGFIPGSDAQEIAPIMDAGNRFTGVIDQIVRSKELYMEGARLKIWFIRR